MHFEVLIEDQSGKTALEILIPKIIDCDQHTFTVHAYKGTGRIPPNLNPNLDPKKRVLLDQLPRLIQGYGQTFAKYPTSYPAVLMIICDLDDRCLHQFRQELIACLERSSPQPETYFCLAIEEGEAWYLGDFNAIKSAYPQVKESVLNSYENDAICGTWELLADAIATGGAKRLTSQGGKSVGQEKMMWAQTIPPQMEVDRNRSPSFCYFRDKLRRAIASP
ncbi:DUF4276 family protein [Spirulina major]|uniref:DUF4276 family protein n=1 Tax=Spirulina major TaxID=270636 RepID=UPI00093458C0|nr:hypothetical protein [Spirulina major]